MEVFFVERFLNICTVHIRALTVFEENWHLFCVCQVVSALAVEKGKRKYK